MCRGGGMRLTQGGRGGGRGMKPCFPRDGYCGYHVAMQEGVSERHVAGLETARPYDATHDPTQNNEEGS